MEINPLNLAALLYFSVLSFTWAQPSGPGEQCRIVVANQPAVPAAAASELHVAYREDAQTLLVTFSNHSARPTYLFSSYLAPAYYASRYLHRVDKRRKTYAVSFIPLLPYLSTKPTDKRILGENSLVNKGQILYEFVKIEPGSVYTLAIPVEALLAAKASSAPLSQPVNPADNTKFYAKKLIHPQPAQPTAKYRLQLEFAVYDRVDLLCTESAYYLDEFRFNDQARSFRVHRVTLTNPTQRLTQLLIPTSVSN